MRGLFAGLLAGFLFFIEVARAASAPCHYDPGCARVLERTMKMYGFGGLTQRVAGVRETLFSGGDGFYYRNIELPTAKDREQRVIEKNLIEVKETSACEDVRSVQFDRLRDVSDGWLSFEGFKVEFMGANCSDPRLLHEGRTFVAIDQCRFDEPPRASINREYFRKMCQAALDITPKPKPVVIAPPKSSASACDAWKYLSERSGMPLLPADERFLRDLSKTINDGDTESRWRAFDHLPPGPKTAKILSAVLLEDNRTEVREQAFNRLRQLVSSHDQDPDSVQAYGKIDPARLPLQLKRDWIVGFMDMPIDRARVAVKHALADQDPESRMDGVHVQVWLYRRSGEVLDWQLVQGAYAGLKDPGDRSAALMEIAALYSDPGVPQAARDRLRPFLEKQEQDPDELISYWAKSALHPPVRPKRSSGK